jgi:purine-binding chemotaxis protein CheW
MSVLHVIFKVGGAEYVLPAADVLQMESFTGATAVPGAPPYVAGIIHVRGRVVPVVDLRVRFGLPPLVPTLDSRVVVVEHHERTVGLLADSAREVVKFGVDQLQAPPTMMTGDGVASGTGFVKSVAYVQKRLLMLLDFAKVIGEESAHVSER